MKSVVVFYRSSDFVVGVRYTRIKNRPKVHFEIAEAIDYPEFCSAQLDDDQVCRCNLIHNGQEVKTFEEATILCDGFAWTPLNLSEFISGYPVKYNLTVNYPLFRNEFVNLYNIIEEYMLPDITKLLNDEIIEGWETENTTQELAA